MAFQFLGFKVGMQVSTLFGQKIYLYELMPIADNAAMFFWYFLTGIIIPCVLGKTIEVIKSKLMVKNA
ncbi:MAG: hypothetical protein PUJ06_11700 [Stecheria intestinalis]|nr:hypothetical protein [Stecheria intestinalis]